MAKSVRFDALRGKSAAKALAAIYSTKALDQYRESVKEPDLYAYQSIRDVIEMVKRAFWSDRIALYLFVDGIPLAKDIVPSDSPRKEC